MITGSDIVVATLARAGGSAPRETITAAVALNHGRRKAFLGIAKAVLGRRVEEIVLADDVAGLRLVDSDETTFTGQLQLPEETARPGGRVRFGDSGARDLERAAAGAQSRNGGER
jgi:hypothetical protein